MVDDAKRQVLERVKKDLSGALRPSQQKEDEK
jgi:hypothetical protein